MIGRIAITGIAPTVDCGRHPAKAVIGQLIDVSATVFREGHDAVAANVVFRGPPDGTSTRRSGPLVLMQPGAPGTDRFHAQVAADRAGSWILTIEAWSDPLATWRHAVLAKAAAGQSGEEMANDLAAGALLLDRIARRPRYRAAVAVRAAAAALRDSTRPVTDRLAPALQADTWAALTADPVRELVTRSETYKVWVDRPLAEFGSWYEFFPRSAGAEIAADGAPLRHGTFADATAELPRIASMGFDIVYLPPVHPIGEVNRKGRNNTVTAQPDDVGSPWAIGSALGGHDAVHPDLGTIEDFDHFVSAAADLGMAVALDLALQCAPDHPWVAAHPEWFTTRPDGSIAYAENPPKKYQDIYPLNFDNDPAGLYAEVLRIVQFWISHGVRIFRVDNPHTKPVNFWEWLINTVHADDPGVIFLAEAFTRPAVMRGLARVGFTQSYTYFTWRTGKQELTEYGVELVESSDYMRPNFFVNTPDILHASLAYGGPGMFAIRAILAATLSPSWGVYSGFELYEDEPVRPDSEEYLHSEKYQLRPRDFAGALEHGRSLEPLIRRLNRIRRGHPALQQMKGLWFHHIAHDGMLCYSRRDPRSGDTVLIVVALDPTGPHWGRTDLRMPALGMTWDERFDAVDLLSGDVYDWGQRNVVGLDPAYRAAHIFAVRPR